MNHELWLAVIQRDKECVLAKVDPAHRCRNRWGTFVASDEDLTVEHVKDQLRMGKRAPSDMAHLVAMCYGGNVAVPSKKQRAAIREYLAHHSKAAA